MEAIKTLKEIISKLSTEEKAAVRTYLKVFVLEWKGDTNKGLMLFEYLIDPNNQKATITDIEAAIYKKPNKPALKKLANRTRIKVLEALIIDINIDREGYPPRSVAVIEIRKKITQGQILHSRGLIKIAKGMLENVIEHCSKYEIYEEQLIALRFLIVTRTMVEGDKYLHHYLKQYEECTYALSAVMRSEINHRKILSRSDFSSEQVISRNELRDMLDEMKDDFAKTDSALIGNYYYNLEAMMAQQVRDYKKARTELLSQYKLVNNYPSVKTPDNLFGVLINLAENDLYLRQFERSFQKSDEAKELCKKGSTNYEVCVEYMYYAKYFMGEHQIACNLLFQNIPSEENSLTFRAGKRSYFLAATFFMLQDFQSALRHLNLVNPIETDKEGWNLGIKILQIMTAIELNEFDEASRKLEALTKYFQNGNGSSNHRAKLIFNILQKLDYYSYQFKVVYQEYRPLLEMLDEAGGALEWQIKSYELVIFHQWFFAKVLHQPFVQQIRSFQLEQDENQIKSENKQPS